MITQDNLFDIATQPLNKDHIYQLINNQYQTIDSDIKKQQGVVYTSPYIARYIIEHTIDVNNIYGKTILEPCLGGGIFIVELLLFLHQHHIDIKRVLPHIYGYDINPQRVQESIDNITQLLYLMDIPYDNECHLSSANFLDMPLEPFDYIIGNPPYINSHHLDQQNKMYLKDSFQTTRVGNSNIFYAFIEKSITLLRDTHAKIGFIIPNNFLYIKSARALREFLLAGRYIHTIIDFNDNLVFRPIRSYNAIVLMDLSVKDNITFSNISQTKDLSKRLDHSSFDAISYNDLDREAWHLIDPSTKYAIQQMEDPKFKLRYMIKTGIATLKDALYIVDDKEGDYLYKMVNGKRYTIEKSITKDFYKISTIKEPHHIKQYKQRIIYPYEEIDGTVRLMSEQQLKSQFPLVYQYLLAHKTSLLSRDNYKIDPHEWYRFGRSQGLKFNNKFKIFFKTFNDKPNFFSL